MQTAPISRTSVSGSASFQPRTDQPPRILVVQNDPFRLHCSAEVLIRNGYEVNAVEDGATAWKELQVINYHLLITDYKLPKVSGMGLIKKLHAARLALPVVLVAEKIPAHQLAKHPSLQPAATLLKSLAIDALLDTVKAVLRMACSPLDHLAARANTITPMLQEILEHGMERVHWGR